MSHYLSTSISETNLVQLPTIKPILPRPPLVIHLASLPKRVSDALYQVWLYFQQQVEPKTKLGMFG
ncbi:MAG: hypothetical protein MUO62_17695 [Anaerolineales bacterium]|nr:hypothetical protein [Anaerolineales bacterium]